MTVGGLASALKLCDVPLSISCVVWGMNCLPLEPNTKSSLRASINTITTFLKRGLGILLQLEADPKKKEYHMKHFTKPTDHFQPRYSSVTVTFFQITLGIRAHKVTTVTKHNNGCFPIITIGLQTPVKKSHNGQNPE